MEQSKEIIEGNILIAEFMGNDVMVTWYDASGKGWNSMVGIDKIDNYKKVFLEYHSSWDWLMPVVEKIAHIEIKDCKVISNGQDSYYDSYYLRTFGLVSSENKDFLVRINRFRLHYSPSLIQATYEAVVEFIQWYNTQNK